MASCTSLWMRVISEAIFALLGASQAAFDGSDGVGRHGSFLSKRVARICMTPSQQMIQPGNQTYSAVDATVIGDP
jgi:hypothetical protein